MKLKYAHYRRLLLNNLRILSPFDAKMRNYLRYKLRPSAERVDLSKVSPVFVTYFVSNRCNLSCSFCMVGNVLNPEDWRNREATVAATETLFSQPIAKNALYVMLSGGEPTLNRDLVEIVRLLKSQGRLVSMTTNGHRLEKLVDPLSTAGLDAINVSLYEENTRKLWETLPRVTGRILTKLAKVITRPMLDDPTAIEEAAELACSTGCAGLYLANVFPTRDAPVDPGDSIIYDRDRQQLEAARKRIARRYRKLAINWPAPAPLLEPPRKLCRMPWYFATFDCQGNLGMCCNSANCTQGNMFYDSPDSVMNTKDWLEVRRAIITPGDRVHPICNHCYMMNDPYGSDV